MKDIRREVRRRQPGRPRRCPSPWRHAACVASTRAVTAPSSGFRRLVLATGVATFVLIIVGGVVRVSDSGLGCGPGGSGFHGWPFCNGDVVPGVDLNSVVEYTHRVVAGVVGIMILALVVHGLAPLPPTCLPRDRGAAACCHRPGRARRRDRRGEPRGGPRGRPPRARDAAARAACSTSGEASSRTCGHERGGPRLPAAGGRGQRGRSSARSSPAATWPARRTTAAPTTSSATAPTTPAARSSPPATATSCRSARRGSWTST